MLRRGAFLLLAFAVAAAAGAAPVDEWRRSLEHTRVLGENNAPEAYRSAQRLRASMPTDATPVDRARILNILARIETHLGLTEQADAHAKEAFAVASASNDKIGQAEADINRSNITINQADMDTHVTVTTRALNTLDGIDRPDLIVEAMLRAAMMYRRIGEFDASVTVPMQAMEVAQRSKLPIALAYAHHGMAVSLHQTGHYDDSFGHYKDMQEQARLANSKLLEALALVGMGAVYTEQNRLKDAESYARAGLTACRSFGGPNCVAHALYSLARNLDHQKRPDDARNLLLEAAEIHRAHQNRIGLWWGLYGLSDHDRAAGRITDAQREAEQAYALGKEINLSLYISKSASQLAALAAQRGDYREAFTLAAQAVELTEKADRSRANSRLADLAQRFRTEARQREIEELQRRNEQQAVEQRWLWTVLGGALLIIAVTAFFLIRLRRSHNLIEAANARLQESQEEIRALNVTLEQRVQARTAELRQQARYLRTLIDMLPMWVWLKDTENRYLVTNQVHAEACGHSVEEMIGKSDRDLSPAAIAESHHADDVEVMASRRRKTTEELLPDGSFRRWMETYKAAVVDEDGTLLGTVGVARDISDRKAAEDARDAALAEAERLAQMRSDFIAQMSHELRTPLNGILGYVQILQRNPALDERQAAGLSVIQQSGQQLLTLINDILDFAKMEAGRLEVRPATVGLRRFLQVVVDIVALRAEQKGLLFNYQPDDDLPDAIQVDERLLRQVLLNLLTNAMKFTDHGQVTLRATKVHRGRLRFAVEDTGTGIATEDFDTIFRPFEQVGESPRRIGGAGLGLAISREFVRRMGGEIHVESRLGEGSIFWFELDTPEVSADLDILPAAGLVCGYEGPRRRILEVDDLPESRRLVVDMLEPLGFDITEAADGREGLALAQARKFDLILIDTVMPNMDGYEMTRQLRRIPDLKETPVIIVSASATAQDRENAMMMGANDFLPKPIDLDMLVEHIGLQLGITWIRGEKGAIGNVPASNVPLVAPPEDEMRTLHHLALQGNMRDILGQADRLMALDERYHPFALRLRQLAGGYQSRAILNLVEEHMKKETT